MGGKKEKHVPYADRVLWYSLIVGGVLVLLPAVPVVPWRVSRVDTNMGNRFVMDRYYTLFGLTNPFGKSVGWFEMKTKMMRKNQELGRPNPVSALVGTVGAELGAGGAAVGCIAWQACKDHVSARYIAYYNVAIGGMCSFLCLILGS